MLTNFDIAEREAYASGYLLNIKEDGTTRVVFLETRPDAYGHSSVIRIVKNATDDLVANAIYALIDKLNNVTKAPW